MTDEFKFPRRDPDGWLVLNVSGGRTSAYLLRRVLDANGGLPERCVPIFANTGKERPETLEFLHEIETRWNVPLVWLEYHIRPDQRPKHHYRVVDFDSADRGGAVFRSLIEAKRRLPSIITRICTSELKVSTIDRYMRRELGVKQYRNVLGIRYDEPKRYMRAIQKEDCRSDYPLVYAKVRERAVNDYWAASGFDLGIPSWMGNCDLCYLKRHRDLVQIIAAEPELAQWWIDAESWARELPRPEVLRNPNISQFNHKRSFPELAAQAASHAGQLQIPIEDDGEPMDCFCSE